MVLKQTQPLDGTRASFSSVENGSGKNKLKIVTLLGYLKKLIKNLSACRIMRKGTGLFPVIFISFRKIFIFYFFFKSKCMPVYLPVGLCI